MRPTLCRLVALVLAGCGSSSAVPGPECIDPPRGPQLVRFSDVTRDSGVDFHYTTPAFQGGGLAVVDLDGDGRPEIVAARRDGGTAVFANRGALRFEELADTGLDLAAGATAIAAVDLDNDGDRDLVLARRDVAHVMTNDGAGRFVEAARFDGSGVTEHVLPTDLDGDGLLDLYFSNYDLTTPTRTQNRLYLNRGEMQFAFAGTQGVGLTWTTTALDFDDDGDQDLYVANDTLLSDAGTNEPATSSLPVDLLLRNDGPGSDGLPRFTDLAAHVGLARPRSSMGGVLGDFDDDGALDLFVPDFGANKVFVRDPSGPFVDRAVRLGLDATTRTNRRCGPDARGDDCLLLSWSAALGDFDHDGLEELLVINGETSPGITPPVLLFERGSEGSYDEVSPDLPCMDARSLVATDLDEDGDQDVVIAHREGPLAIFENRGAPPSRSWLRVALRGRTSNHEGIGAVVTLRLANGRVLIRAVGAGGVIHSAGPAEAFFGLGDEAVEHVHVRWPSGRSTQLREPPTGVSLVIDENG